MPAFLHDTDPGWNPPPTDASLWRYMTLARLVHLLLRRDDGLGRLFFCRADYLDDQFEAAAARSEGDGPLDGGSRNTRVDTHLPGLAGISSWHRNETESAALWEIFSNNEGGVAVRSNLDRLGRSLEPAGRASEVGVGSVQYVEFDVDDPPALPAAVLQKRPQFSHENEVRAVLLGEQELEPPGAFLPCDASLLIETIVVSPHSGEWLIETVEGVTRELGYDFPITHSQMDRSPHG